jgi:ABC-type multidrug transport system ATPase subunit
LIIHVYHRRGAFFLDIPFLEAWAQNIVARAGFSRSASEPVSAFSGGMLRRILLARELAGEARLVILSEPEAGLDAPSREQFARDLRDWTRQGKAALVFKTAGSAAETSAYS